MADIGEKSYLMSGIAQETTAQEILGAVSNVAQQENVQEILEKINNLKDDFSNTPDVVKLRCDVLPMKYIDDTRTNYAEPITLYGKKKIHKVGIRKSGNGLPTHYIDVIIDGTTYSLNSSENYLNLDREGMLMCYGSNTIDHMSGLSVRKRPWYDFYQTGDTAGNPDHFFVAKFICEDSITFKVKLFTNGGTGMAGKIGAYLIVYYEEC